MGSMTLADFRSEVGSALARTVDNTRLDRWINQAIWEFAYAFKFHVLEATGSIDTVPGQESYDLSLISLVVPPFRAMSESGVEVVQPSDCIGRLLSETRVHWRLSRDTSTDTTLWGAPTHYHVYGTFLFIRPKPDIDYTLEFDYWTGVKLTDIDQVSPFNADWDDIIVAGALYRAFRAFGNFDRYKNVRNDFLAGVRSRVMDEDLEEFPVGGVSLAQGPMDDVIR